MFFFYLAFGTLLFECAAVEQEIVNCNSPSSCSLFESSNGLTYDGSHGYTLDQIVVTDDLWYSSDGTWTFFFTFSKTENVVVNTVLETRDSTSYRIEISNDAGENLQIDNSPGSTVGLLSYAGNMEIVYAGLTNSLQIIDRISITLECPNNHVPEFDSSTKSMSCPVNPCNAPSPDNHQCVNSFCTFDLTATDDYTCTCLSGYSEEDSRNCVDIDECQSTNDCLLATMTCVNTLGSYECHCNEQGYERVSLRSFTSFYECIDVNECQRDFDCPANSLCINTEGSYDCVCHNGFAPLYNTFGYMESCSDIDECEAGLDNCAPAANGGICNNDDGSFTCDCENGFNLVGSGCSDIDECDDSNICGDPTASCDNTPGSYACNCPQFQTYDGSTCVDLDECAENVYDCTDNAHCDNKDDGYDCKCNTGYETSVGGSETDDDKCEDVDECETRCQGDHFICENTIGSVRCLCEPGYEGTTTCNDIDECEQGTHDCSFVHGGCNNIEGSFECFCDTGFVLDPDFNKCMDENECLGDGERENCWSLAVPNKYFVAKCFNTKGSFVCQCPPGFHGTGRNGDDGCIDIDECLTNVAFDEPCDDNEVCENTVGSFCCDECKTGFKRDDDDCVDIDECMAVESPCEQQNSVCKNTHGSFHCGCNDGYRSYNDECLREAFWSDWQDDGECSELCDGGSLRQKRHCVAAIPDDACVGIETSQVIPCNTEPCGNRIIVKKGSNCKGTTLIRNHEELLEFVGVDHVEYAKLSTHLLATWNERIFEKNRKDCYNFHNNSFDIAIAEDIATVEENINHYEDVIGQLMITIDCNSNVELDSALFREFEEFGRLKFTMQHVLDDLRFKKESLNIRHQECERKDMLSAEHA